MAIQKGHLSFDFLFVVPGVAIGLAIVRVCQFLGDLLVYGNSSEWTRFPALWMVIWSIALLAYTAQYWFFSAKRRERKDYSRSFSAYICILLMPVLISFMSTVLCPSFDEPAFTEIGVHFKTQSPLLYVLIGLSLWAATIESLVLNEPHSELSYPSENHVRVAVGAIFVSAGIAMKISPLSTDLDKDFFMAIISVFFVLFRIAMFRWPI